MFSDLSFFSLIAIIGLVIFLVVYLVWFFFIIYHLIRFGVGPQPKRLAFIFLLGSLVLIVAAFLAYSQVDFSSFNI